MNSESYNASQNQKEATEVISRNIKPGHEKDYDDWLRRYMKLENKAPGYLSTTIIAPGGNSSTVRYIINRFSDKASMDAWKNSREALALVEEANGCSTRHYVSATGLETWFFVPDFKAIIPPPRWKMAVIVFIAAYIVSSLSRSVLTPFLPSWPFLINTVIYTSILVVSLTFIMMPVLSKLLRRWLYPPVRYSE